MAHVLLSRLRATTTNQKTFYDILTKWKFLDSVNPQWPDRDRSIKEALFQQLYLVFKVWAQATKKPEDGAPPQPNGNIVGRFFSAFVWFMALEGPQRISPVNHTAGDELGNLEELAQPIYLTNILLQSIKRSCPEIMGPGVETFVQNLIVTIQNTVAYFHNLYEIAHGTALENDVDGYTNLIKLTEMRMAQLLEDLDIQMHVPEHMVSYLFYLLRSACNMGSYVLQWRLLVIATGQPQGDHEDICHMSTGSGQEVFGDIKTINERRELLVLDSFFARFLFVVQYIENYTKLQRDSKDRVLIKYPHSTIVMAAKKPIYQDSDVVKATKPLITKVERCKDNQQIIWVVRDWLREEGYGERQYIASSITKKRTRGWSTMEP